MIQGIYAPNKIECLIGSKLIYPNFQPIMDLSAGRVYSYESLMRCQKNLNPIQLFRLAMQQDCLYELDTLGIENSVQTFSKLTGGKESILFLNVFPSTLLHASFLPFIEELILENHIPSTAVVLEINEAKEEEKIWEVRALRDVVTILRQGGFRIALDDVGEGAASLKKIIKIEPDYIKMPRYFAENLASHSQKQKLLEMMSHFCGEQMGMVLEGIETVEDLEVAKQIGISLGQGFLLGRPSGELLN